MGACSGTRSGVRYNARFLASVRLMNILFVHQNFPGQFKHLAPELARRGHRVVAAIMRDPGVRNWKGVELFPYTPARGSTPGIHPWVGDFEAKTVRGEACMRAALTLRAQGFTPDVIVAHPGWGESLFLKEVWPQARLGIYCEFYYHATGTDVGFDPEFGMPGVAEACRISLKNINNMLHFGIADAGIAPTHWQASTFPPAFRDRISVIHDGIDTAALTPDGNARFTLGDIQLGRGDEVITFVNRNLEPYRGYHIFMRSLPVLLRRRPEARVVIVGGDEVSYGSQAPEGRTWKEVFAAEVAPELGKDGARVHFVGKLAYDDFVRLMQVSTVHVYLTYPFVLSWSLLEAMSLGCAIVASDTAPLREAIVHDETGRLVDFFDASALAAATIALLEDPQARARLGAAARAFARAHYDLETVCLPRQLAWVDGLAAGRTGN
jgi:glycosyltransferase involved in cell wall biosynthesis